MMMQEMAETSNSTRWTLPTSALQASYQEMATDGRRGHEGIALWAGTETPGLPGHVVVSHVLLLRGPGISKSRFQIRVSAELLNDVTDELTAIGGDVYLVGQVHGHPPGARVDLSETDIRYGIQMPDYLSVVAPRFGMDTEPRLDECGVHVFESGRGYRRLATHEARARLVIDPNHPVDIRIVGEVSTGSRDADLSHPAQTTEGEPA